MLDKKHLIQKFMQSQPELYQTPAKKEVKDEALVDSEEVGLQEASSQGLKRGSSCDWKLSDEIHRNFRTWEKVPPAQLRRLITAVAPLSCSIDRLSVYRTAGMREVPRSPLLQLWELSTKHRVMMWEMSGTSRL